MDERALGVGGWVGHEVTTGLARPWHTFLVCGKRACNVVLARLQQRLNVCKGLSKEFKGSSVCG